MLDEIISAILERKHEVFGPDLKLKGQALEDHIMAYSHLREFEILIACDWNINIGTGYDILAALLKMSNPSYNFSQMMHVT